MITFVPLFVSPGRLRLGPGGEGRRRAGRGRPAGSGRDGRVYATYPTPAPPATVDDVVAHLEHAREVAGIDHLGLGGDFDGVAVMPVGLQDVVRLPAAARRVGDRGWSDDDLAPADLRQHQPGAARRRGVAVDRSGPAPSLATARARCR